MNRDYERRRDLLLLHADSPPPWTPAALGPQYWYDPADDYTTLAADPAISAWAKRFGTGTGSLAIAPPNQPTRALDGASRRVLGFAAASAQYLANANSITAGTIFVVAKFDGAAFTDYQGLFTGATATAGYGLWLGVTGTANFFRDGGTTTPATWVRYRDGVLSDAAGCGAWHIYEGVDTGAPIAMPAFQAGKDRNAARYWNGQIGDIITYPTDIGAANRGLVRAWLKAKWGTP